MPDRWVLYPVERRLDRRIVRQCMSLLRDTSDVHRLRDFPAGESSLDRQAKRLASRIADEGYVRVSCHFPTSSSDPDTIDMCIVYQRLRHRLTTYSEPWCVSIGFVQTLLPKPTIPAPTNPTQEYVDFATLLNKQIHDDLTLKFDPAATAWFLIDDASDETESEAALRATRIGELEYVARTNSDIRKLWRSVCSGLEDWPKRNGLKIRGWGKPGDEQVYVTTVEV